MLRPFAYVCDCQLLSGCAVAYAATAALMALSMLSAVPICWSSCAPKQV